MSLVSSALGEALWKLRGKPRLESALEGFESNAKDYKAKEREIYKRIIETHNNPLLREVAQKNKLMIIEPKSPIEPGLWYGGNGFTAETVDRRKGATGSSLSDWYKDYHNFEEKDGLLITIIPESGKYELFELYPENTPEQLERKLVAAIESLPVYSSNKSYWR